MPAGEPNENEPAVGRLAGVGVAVTRAEDQTGPLTLLLERERARVVHWPCVSFAPPADTDPLTRALADLDAFDLIVVTSPRAAEVLVRGADHAPARARIAAAGPVTAGRLEAAGWVVHIVPESFGGGPLVEALAAGGEGRDARILYPCSDRALPATRDGLARLGATVERVIAYRTLPLSPAADQIVADVVAGDVHVVTFASPSAVEGLCGALTGTEAASLFGRVRTVAIGDTTATALRDAGYATTALARPSSLAGLVEAVVIAAGPATPTQTESAT